MRPTSSNIDYHINFNSGTDSAHLPVLFLHGFTGSGASWISVRQSLTGASLTIDLPGHGQSKIIDPDQPISVYSFIRDVNHILDELSLSKVHLCGYSMGGRLALVLALTHPKRIQSLVLESSSPGIEDGQERRTRKQADEKLAQRIVADFPAIYC